MVMSTMMEHFKVGIEIRMRRKGKSDLEIAKALNKILKKYENNGLLSTTDIVATEEDAIITELSKEDRMKQLAAYYQDKTVFTEKEQVKVDILTECGEYGRTDLHVAVLERDLSKLQDLLKNGSDPYIADNSGNTPFRLAVLEAFPEVIQFFESHGINS